ncbi:unnamed protein product, partial [Linum tenue]
MEKLGLTSLALPHMELILGPGSTPLLNPANGSTFHLPLLIFLEEESG